MVTPGSRKSNKSKAPNPEAIVREDDLLSGQSLAESGEVSAGDEALAQDNDSHALRQREQLDKAGRQEFFLPVTGFVWFYQEEVKVIDHPSFQRLSKVNQLGHTHLVYRGGTHKRFEHSLGTVHIVQRMIDAVRHNAHKLRGNGQQARKMLSYEEERFVRLGALLHDIGHLACGHTIEDELGLAGRHDGQKRLGLVFEGDQWKDENSRTLSVVIDEQFSKFLPTALRSANVKASQIVQLLIRKSPDKEETDSLGAAYEALSASGDVRLGVCRDMIGNTICADLLDYLHRDWHHLGKGRPFDDRILQYMEIRGNGLDNERPSAADQFVISLGQPPKVRTDAVSAILELLEWRFQLAESALFHRTKLTIAAMLDRALFELWGDSRNGDLEVKLLPLSDDELIQTCIREASGLKKERGDTAADLLRRLDRRQLYTDIATRTYDDISDDTRPDIIKNYGTSAEAPRNRSNALRLLEADFDLPRGSLAMYCPGEGMNHKIAEVKVAVSSHIEQLCDYEQNHALGLTGGHLRAQLHRFTRLWRIHFVINSNEKQRLENKGLIALLRTAIDKVVLGQLKDGETAEEAAREIAMSLTTRTESPWYGRSLVDEVPIAAYKKEPYGEYITGASSLKAHFTEE